VLQSVAANSANFYRPFTLHSGREIDRPTGVLVEIQRRIKIALLQPINFPDSFHGGIKGHSPRTNAAEHLGKSCVVKIDIRKFYPSVSCERVYGIWTTYFGFGRDIASVLTQLTTYKGHLPQGTSTSGYLANLALVESDELVKDITRQLAVHHTFFVDDLSVSGDRAREALGPVIDVIRKSAKFSIGRDKTTIMSAADAQVVTGLGVNGKQASVPRKEIAKIRCALRELEASLREGAAGSDRLERRIRGRIAYVQQTNPGAATRLDRKLRLITPASSR
jgi:hypothetical protein